jgi:hypothetical protein
LPSCPQSLLRNRSTAMVAEILVGKLPAL